MVLKYFNTVEYPLHIFGHSILIRAHENHNKQGGNLQLMKEFNASIIKLGVLEIPLKGQPFTSSNKQRNPLLEKLDWCFIKQYWSTLFPNTQSETLATNTSDHVPWIVIVKTSVIKTHIFCFENYWLHHEDFNSVFQDIRQQPIYQPDTTKKLMDKIQTCEKGP